MVAARTHTHRPSHRQRNGFTLLEVIIAISILGVMVGLNYKILSGVIQAKRLLDDRREGLFMANSVLTRISRELQMITRRPIMPSCESATGQADGSGEQPATPPQGQSLAKPLLLGESTISGSSITFLAREAGQYIPDGGTHSGVVQITYRVAEDPEQKEPGSRGLLLIRDEIPNTKPLAKACKSVLHFPITNRLASLEFQYYDSKTQEWSTAWDAERAGRLPRIVQFTVGLFRPDGQVQRYTSSVLVSAGG